jgi:hypothetical protein
MKPPLFALLATLVLLLIGLVLYAIPFLPTDSR